VGLAERGESGAHLCLLAWMAAARVRMRRTRFRDRISTIFPSTRPTPARRLGSLEGGHAFPGGRYLRDRWREVRIPRVRPEPVDAGGAQVPHLAGPSDRREPIHPVAVIRDRSIVPSGWIPARRATTIIRPCRRKARSILAGLDAMSKVKSSGPRPMSVIRGLATAMGRALWSPSAVSMAMDSWTLPTGMPRDFSKSPIRRSRVAILPGGFRLRKCTASSPATRRRQGPGRPGGMAC